MKTHVLLFSAQPTVAGMDETEIEARVEIHGAANWPEAEHYARALIETPCSWLLTRKEIRR